MIGNTEPIVLPTISTALCIGMTAIGGSESMPVTLTGITFTLVDQAFMQCIEADIAGELIAEEVGIVVEISASEKADVT